MRKHHTKIATIDKVVVEFLGGAENKKMHEEKHAFVESLVDFYLPYPSRNTSGEKKNELFHLVSQYGTPGKHTSIVDFLLGVML